MMEQVLAVNGKPLGDRPLAQLMLPGQPSYELVVRRDELDRGLEGALWPVGGQRPMRPPAGFKGPGRSCAVRSAASAARKLGVALAARLSLLPR